MGAKAGHEQAAGPGRRFGSLHARHLQLLEWPGRPHDVFSVQEEPSKRYHLILPAFFRLLDTLHRDGRAFAVIFRTFGTDLPRALRAVSCALAGQHPQFPTLRDVALPVDLTPGQIRCGKREVVLTRGAERLATREDGRKLYDYFSSFEGIGGFQDHFEWWARNNFSSRGGKPLWIDPHDPGVHHIFIDDNIRLDDADTIVHPQVFSEPGSSSPRRVPTSELYDVCLVQTDLLEAIADEDYFLRCVRRCEKNYDRYLACMEKDTLSQRLGAAEVLDLPAQCWTALPPLPTPRAGAAALALGKQILVVGGVDAAQSPLASVEVYHVDEGKWEKKAALAQPSMGISAVQRDGAVYALGGMGADTSPQALVRVYEPAKDHWQPLPSMPTPCYGASAFLQGNKIFVLGGRQGKLPVTAFEAFDLETRSWTRYPSVPSRRAFAACAMVDGVVFSLGGLQQPGPHNFYSRPHFVNTVEMFDPAQGAWRKPNRAIRMREKRADFVAGCLGGRVVAMGGLGNQSCPLDSVEGFSLSQKKWEPLPPMPTGRCSCSSCPTPSLLFVIGGVAQGPSGAVEALCLREVP
ncbi:kelch domain-containing protein 8B [Athene cunicularia]|uniref:kelch domain-containing protein 8B n=1 Tax=Athene cunicularia TaxID=194338 RepID=UPI000EF721D6|nr:kelch domain-containing protein 8B [Athene cunicularia]